MTPFLAVLRVVKVLPQVQRTSVSTYSGWMPFFTVLLLEVEVAGSCRAGRAHVNRNHHQCARPTTGPRGPSFPCSLPAAVLIHGSSHSAIRGAGTARWMSKGHSLTTGNGGSRGRGPRGFSRRRRGRGPASSSTPA